MVELLDAIVADKCSPLWGDNYVHQVPNPPTELLQPANQNYSTSDTWDTAEFRELARQYYELQFASPNWPACQPHEVDSAPLEAGPAPAATGDILNWSCDWPTNACTCSKFIDQFLLDDFKSEP